MTTFEIMKKERKPGSGGKRPGSGKKNRYGEKTVQLNVQVPKSHRAALKQLIKDYLDQVAESVKNVKL